MLRNQIKKFLTGLTISQEYVCLNSNELQHPLSVFLSLDSKKLDISSSHLFLGYKPVILASSFKVNDQNFQVVKNQKEITIDFENSKPILPTCLARLELKKIGEKILGNDALLFYEGEFGEHSFLRSIHQKINEQREKRRKSNPNNVGLPGNLLDQVRIAYSVPRSISIITVSDGKRINMFPTDLHGPVGDKFYAGSLRMGGLANDQVEKFKQIVISEVEPLFYKQAYSLGKNHMKELQAESEFSLNAIRSKHFDFPLPASAVSYRELKKIDSQDIGIHRIHFYEIIHRQILQEDKQSLTHIHQYYAQWRLDQGIYTPMLLR